MIAGSGDRQAVWSRYWAQGALHSCGGSYGDLYGGAIGAFWRQVYRELQPPCRVLDLACGNGPLGRMLLDVRTEDDIRCDAVDLAEVAPRWLDALPAGHRLRFHSGVRTESLPFDDASFDWVVSQYGLEYTDRAATTAEVRRVRKAGSSVALVLHARASRPVQLAQHEVTHIDLLTQGDGLLAALHAVCEPFARAATEAGRRALAQDAGAERLRQRFGQAQDEVRQQAAVSPAPDLLLESAQWVGDVLQLAQSQGAQAGQAAVHRIEASLSDARLRLVELVDHALDEAEVAGLAETLRRDVGETARIGTVVDRGHLMGWSLRLDPTR